MWNKVDLLPDEARETLLARVARPAGSTAAPVVAVSAVTGEGIEHLQALLAELVDPGAALDLRFSAADGEALAWLYRHGRVTDRAEENDGGVRVSVKLDAQALGRFERLFPEVAAG